MKQIPIQKTLIFFAILDAMLIGGYGFLCLTSYTNAAKATELYVSLHQNASEQTNAHKVSSSIDATAEERAMLNTFFISGNNAVSFLEKIESLGRKSKVTLHTASFTPNGKAGTLEHVFVVDGRFEDIYNLLALLETMPYQITVKNVSMNKNENKDNATGRVSPWIASFTIVLSSYLP